MPKSREGAVQLHPLNMRISGPQLEALSELRETTGLPIMEHVRRALDAYIARIERAPAKPKARIVKRRRT